MKCVLTGNVGPDRVDQSQRELSPRAKCFPSGPPTQIIRTHCFLNSLQQILQKPILLDQIGSFFSLLATQINMAPRHFFLFFFFMILQKLCSAIAVLQHITHTAIFTWMLVEGIHLYIKLVKVFSVHKLYITYVVIGWGKALFTAFIISLI